MRRMRPLSARRVFADGAPVTVRVYCVTVRCVAQAFFPLPYIREPRVFPRIPVTNSEKQ